MKKTQTQIVMDRLNEVGYVDNFWAIHNYILRLGAIVHGLRTAGWELRGEFGEGANRKNFCYHLVKKPKLTLFT